jgi:hypothetical protein
MPSRVPGSDTRGPRHQRPDLLDHRLRPGAGDRRVATSQSIHRIPQGRCKVGRRHVGHAPHLHAAPSRARSIAAPLRNGDNARLPGPWMATYLLPFYPPNHVSVRGPPTVMRSISRQERPRARQLSCTSTAVTTTANVNGPTTGSTPANPRNLHVAHCFCSFRHLDQCPLSGRLEWFVNSSAANAAAASTIRNRA